MYLNNQQLAGYLRRTRSNPIEPTFSQDFVYEPQEQELLDVFNDDGKDPLVSQQIQAYLERTGGQPGTFTDLLRDSPNYRTYLSTQQPNQPNQPNQPQDNTNIEGGADSKDKSSKLPILAFMGVVLVGGIYLYSKAQKADDETIAGLLP
jgi:hypothetical protein